MSRHGAILLAATGSLALLCGAWGFQYLGGLAPCTMCYWQRYPHMAALVIAMLALMLPGRFWPILGAVAALSSAAIGVYHTGVERKWWDGPAGCTSGDISGLTPQELLDQIMAAPVVRCDEVAWQLMGLSMASWNAILSAGLALIWLWAARRVV